jgi:hypothetical protein
VKPPRQGFVLHNEHNMTQPRFNFTNDKHIRLFEAVPRARQANDPDTLGRGQGSVKPTGSGLQVKEMYRRESAFIFGMP